MGKPVQSLTVLQNWDCHGCTDCCHEYRVHVTDEERSRIERQGWEQLPEYQGVPLFVREKRFSGPYRLNSRSDGACIFLDPNGGCRIHAKFGSEAKPLACRIYPFVLVPAGNHWRVGLRYACPSVTRDQGSPVDTHLPELREYAQLLEAREAVNGDLAEPPRLQSGQTVAWEDLILFMRAIRGIIHDTTHPIERRIRHALHLIRTCRSAKFDKVRGKRLNEFLKLITPETGREVEYSPEEVPPPTWVGRMLFRPTVALYARKDTGRHRGISKYGRLALLWSAWRFAQGVGKVPRVHALIPEVRFEQIEEPCGPLTSEMQEMLRRYYEVKLESMQFCGVTNFRFDFWDGLDSLFLTYPAILWLARALVDCLRSEALMRAIRIVDDNFGFNPLLGSRRQLWTTRILASRGEISRLVAWYSR